MKSLLFKGIEKEGLMTFQNLAELSQKTFSAAALLSGETVDLFQLLGYNVIA